MNTKPQPSFLRVLQSDYVSALALLAPAALWLVWGLDLMGFSLQRRGRTATFDDPGWLLQVAIVVTVVGVALAIWRIRAVYAFFARGVGRPGVIESVEFFRDRGRVTFRYDHEGQSYERGSGIMKNARTKALEPGQELTVIVDPENPKKAMIRSLYV
jgi:hypothetical protein